MEFKNYMEDVVFMLIDEVLNNRDDVCQCKRCRHDICAKTLNQLYPKYVVSDVGHTYTKFETLKTQTRAQVLVELLHSVEAVKNFPRHNNNNEIDF